MLTISICDDDNYQRCCLKNFLLEWSESRGQSIAVHEYESAERFLFDYPERPCDLLLLDIKMNAINGMELAKKLRKSGDLLPIIFITGYSDYIGEDYDVQALHYLLKPLDKRKLFEVLDRYARHVSEKGDFFLALNEGYAHVSPDDIMYIESFGKKSEVHLAAGNTVAAQMSLSEFETLSGFVHTHRSYIVNLHYVRGIGKTSAALDNGREVPVSRRLQAQLMRQFIDYYKG